MSEETKVATETASEETTKETNHDSSDDKLKAERAYSQKQRRAKQEAITERDEALAKLAKAEEDKLKEKEDFKALYEKVSSENESLTANSEKWAKYEEAKRLSLIEQHPEDDREALVGLPLDTLEYVTSKINSSKANAPEVVGNPRGNKELPTDWTKMSAEDLKNNWDDIVANARNRSRKN